MLETWEPFIFISTIPVSASHTTLCQINESFYAPISVPSGGDYVPLSLVHQYQLLRESAYDSIFEIPGSYDPMFVLRVQDFWPECLVWRLCIRFLFLYLRDLLLISVGYPPPAHVNVKLVTILMNRAFSEFQHRISGISGWYILCINLTFGK